MRGKTLPFFGGLVLFLMLACGVGLFSGAVRLTPGDLLHTPIGQLRLARVLLTAVVGAGLSVAGAVFQGVLRNALADPYVLGVSSGAGLGAVVVLASGLAGIGIWVQPMGAFVGALGTIALVYALARTRAGTLPVQTLLLSGVVVASILGSVLMFLVSQSSAEELHSVVWWLLGNLQVFDWRLIWVSGGCVVVGVTLLMLLAPELNLLTLGEEPAAHLGLRVERAKVLLFVLASLITGAVVAVAGLIGFVGLIVPHAVRLGGGPDHRRLIPASALGGAAFLVLCDAAARTLAAPVEVPIGVVTSCLGGPFFLYLLKRGRRGAP